MSETIRDAVRAVTGKEHDEVLAARIAQLEAALAEKDEWIETLDSTLLERGAALATERAALLAASAQVVRLEAELGEAEGSEAALAVAHEALGSAYWVLLRVDLAGDLGEAVAGARRLVDAALSAPAPQRAARLDKLRREVCRIAEAVRPGVGPWSEETWTHFWAALAALRAEEEQNA